MRIIRVFPRRTRATPCDELAFVGEPTLFAEGDAVHISVTFSWDLPETERLEKEWRHIAPVTIGGPATGERGEAFEPGMYIKNGYVITSRGCPNRCWFCSVWRREGEAVRELPITDGYNVLDDNLLACSDEHIKAVFQMLSAQKQRPLFTGGLEAARLKQWHIDEFKKVRPKEMFFAYDTPDDREPLYEAGKVLKANGFKIHAPLCAYVLCGFPGDTLEKAEWRFIDCAKAGFLPIAMVYRDKSGERAKEWVKFGRQWGRQCFSYTKIRDIVREHGGKGIGDYEEVLNAAR